ncbi:aminotransferase class V-fold PLP-dependent enzyme, partial [Nocardioides sp.]|uniref:aminotransferase class V-fold PLP-dependent enzyme n=1 Tax=Nocardioides sp. TaxID=35761 RepID=UPI00272005F7
MTRAPAHLTLMRQADDAIDAIDAATQESALTPLAGAGPDDGRLAHPATRRRGAETPSLHTAEAQLLGFVADLLQAPDEAAGLVVAGVTEAAVVVLRGARDAGPGLKRATVVLPSSAHPAYFAAAETVGLVPVVVPVDLDGRAPLGAMAAAIHEDTVLVVASAPSYSHGTVDPVGWLAAATVAKGVPLHVDATSGGWAMAYAERVGRVGPSWGFAVGAVASVALDVGPETGAAADLTVVIHRDPAG